MRWLISYNGGRGEATSMPVLLQFYLPNPPRPSGTSSNPRPRGSQRPLLLLRPLVYPILNTYIQWILTGHLCMCREALGGKEPKSSLTEVWTNRCLFSSDNKKVPLDKFTVSLSVTHLAFSTYVSLLVIGWPAWPSGIQSASKQEEGRTEALSLKVLLMRKPVFPRILQSILNGFIEVRLTYKTAHT